MAMQGAARRVLGLVQGLAPALEQKLGGALAVQNLMNSDLHTTTSRSASQPADVPATAELHKPAALATALGETGKAQLPQALHQLTTTNYSRGGIDSSRRTGEGIRSLHNMRDNRGMGTTTLHEPELLQNLPAWLVRTLEECAPAIVISVAAWYNNKLREWADAKADLRKEIADTKEDVIKTQKELVAREKVIADGRVEVERMSRRLGLQTTLYLQKQGLFDMRGLLEYVGDDLYETLPPATNPSTARVTRTRKFESVLNDAAYAPLLTALSQHIEGSKRSADVARRLTQVYQQLSKHVHNRYTPAEWRASGDQLRIVEGALARADCRLLEEICTFFGIDFTNTKLEVEEGPPLEAEK
ncbi:hypothetical protein KFL_014190010, partial [Klebsormidium nitens]